jgi:hypothetical protein
VVWSTLPVIGKSVVIIDSGEVVTTNVKLTTKETLVLSLKHEEDDFRTR